MALATASPFPAFPDLDGTALDNGRIYFGQPNLNPETNPVEVYWDAAGTQPAAQPIRTMNGFPLRNGTPAIVYASGNYSMLVKNRRGVQVFYARDAAELNNDITLQAQVTGVTTRLANKALAADGAGMSGFNASSTYAAGTSGAKMKQALCPLDYPWLAVGDGTTDDTAALAAFFAAVPSNSLVDLAGRSYAIYSTVAGVTSGDAVVLASVPRLSGQTNVTIRNGRIFAYGANASSTKYRFPSTFAIDGCTNISLQNVQLAAKGENWGNSDASSALSADLRRPFLAQNGGHALVITRSKSVVCDAACSFTKAGSVGAFYASSSDDIYVNGSYSSAESLGYAAFSIDGWCGASSVSGFAKHRLYLNGVRTDKNGATYGSKGCVVAEDKDTYVYVSGGSFKDAYANGSATHLGAAFISNTAHVYVDGAEVENCAAIGLTTNSGPDETVLEVRATGGRAIRTAMHIIDRTSFGDHLVRYHACYAEISGTSLWSETELSIPSVIANRKVTSTARVDVIGCETSGAHTFAINERASYGGIRVLGGRHIVTDRIFDSAGWGGASGGTQRGYEVKGTRFDVYLANTAVVSTAKCVATDAMNAIKNQDSGGVFTYQYIDFDRDAVVKANLMREFISVSNLGSAGLAEKRVLNQRLLDCFQATNTAGDGYVGRVKCTAVGAVSGGNINITFALLDNKRAETGVLVDDAYANRKFVSVASGPAAVGTELRATYLVNSTSSNFTVGATYPINFSD